MDRKQIFREARRYDKQFHFTLNVAHAHIVRHGHIIFEAVWAEDEKYFFHIERQNDSTYVFSEYRTLEEYKKAVKDMKLVSELERLSLHIEVKAKNCHLFDDSSYGRTLQHNFGRFEYGLENQDVVTIDFNLKRACEGQLFGYDGQLAFREIIWFECGLFYHIVYQNFEYVFEEISEREYSTAISFWISHGVISGTTKFSVFSGFQTCEIAEKRTFLRKNVHLPLQSVYQKYL